MAVNNQEISISVVNYIVENPLKEETREVAYIIFEI